MEKQNRYQASCREDRYREFGLDFLNKQKKKKRCLKIPLFSRSLSSCGAKLSETCECGLVRGTGSIILSHSF